MTEKNVASAVVLNVFMSAAEMAHSCPESLGDFEDAEADLTIEKLPGLKDPEKKFDTPVVTVNGKRFAVSYELRPLE